MSSCLEKQRLLIEQFKSCHTLEDRYQKIIELGRALPPLSPEHKIEENIVRGCQSIVHLHSILENEKIYFTASSEALISSGLAALLIAVYNGESPETILTCKPTFIEELQIHATLSPGRSNGLSSMLLRMQQDALKFLVYSSRG